MKKRKRHGPEEIIRQLREAELALGRGEPLAATLRRLEVSDQTYYRWRQQYGGMKPADAKRLKELDRENARLKEIVADQALDTVRPAERSEDGISMLKELARGNF